MWPIVRRIIQKVRPKFDESSHGLASSSWKIQYWEKLRLWADHDFDQPHFHSVVFEYMVNFMTLPVKILDKEEMWQYYEKNKDLFFSTCEKSGSCFPNCIEAWDSNIKGGSDIHEAFSLIMRGQKKN